MQAKLKAAGVSVKEWASMVISDKTPAEINEFLDARALGNLVKNYMALRVAEGRPGSKEKATAFVIRMRSEY